MVHGIKHRRDIHSRDIIVQVVQQRDDVVLQVMDDDVIHTLRLERITVVHI